MLLRGDLGTIRNDPARVFGSREVLYHDPGPLCGGGLVEKVVKMAVFGVRRARGGTFFRFWVEKNDSSDFDALAFKNAPSVVRWARKRFLR